MKSLKIKTASAVLLLSLFAVSASAQPQQGRRAPQGGKEPISAEKMAEISTDKLDQKLELTDAQESKIYAINLKYAQEREANKEARPERPAKGSEEAKAERPDREEMKAKMEAAQAQRKAQLVEIMGVLTDSQKVDYALMLGEQKQHRGPQAPRAGQQGKGRGEQKGGQECKEGQGKPRGGKEGQGQAEGRPQRRPEGAEAPAEK